MRKKIRTILYRVAVVSNGKGTIALETRDANAAENKFRDLVADYVEKKYTEKFSDKELIYGYFNGTDYVYPLEAMKAVSERVLKTIKDAGRSYFINEDGKVEIYVETIYCVEEVTI